MFVKHWLGLMFFAAKVVNAVSNNRTRHLNLAQRRRKQHRRRLWSASTATVEALEARICLSAISWDGGGDGIHWSDPANWQADVLPTADDDVSINFGSATIIHDSGDHAVKSLATSNPLEISGGKITIGTFFQINNTVTLRGGTIQGGTLTEVAGDFVLTPQGGILSGVTLNGSLDIKTFRAKATIQNGFTLNGTATFARDALLFFEGTQTLAGQATLNFENQPGATNGLVASTDGMTLTIGDQITLRGGNSDDGGTTIGYNPYVPGGTNTSIINRGTIIPDIAGGRIIIRPRGTGTFSNLGHIALEGGTLDLEADATPTSLGNITRTAGNLRLFRTMDLAGTTVNLADVGGPWTLQGGTIQNGTINQTSVAKLYFSAAGGTLNRITLNGSLDMTRFRSRVTIKNGLTFNGTATMGADALMSFEGTQTLGGNATFLFQNVPGSTNGLVAGSDGMTLTIGEQITLRGGNSDEGGATLGYNPYFPSGTNTSIVNLGTIIADTSGGKMVIRPRGTGTFVNLGRISIDGGIVDLDADATPDSLGDISRTTGSLRLFRTMDLMGTTVNLADLAGPWTLQGGTIKNGTMIESGDATLFLSPSGGTLDGVTLNGDLDMTPFRSKATLRNGFTLNGTATLGADALLSFEGTQSLEGQGTFLFRNVPGSTNGLVTSTDGMTLTIGEHITLRGGNSDEGGSTIGLNPYTQGGNNTSIVNRGTIIADTNGGRFVIRPKGTGTFTNLGSISLAGGTLDLDADVTPTSLGNITRTAGGVRLFRTLDISGSTVNLTNLGGPWTLQGGTIKGGTIKGGTINESSDAKLTLSPAGGVLDGVTLNGPLEMTSFRAGATIRNGLTLNGTANLGADALLFFEGTQTLSGQADIIFQNVPGATNGLVARTDNMTLTIGPNVTLRGGNSDFGGSTIGYNQFTAGGINTNIVNQGTIDVSTPGSRILIMPRGTGTFTNNGSLIVRDNATLEVTTSLTIPNPSNLTIAPTGVFRTQGSLLIAEDDPETLAGSLQFNGTGTAQAPQLLEVRSNDLGLSLQGFFHNSAIASLVLSNSTYVKLVNQFENAPGTVAEALYAESIVIPAGSTLDLNGLNVYTTALQQAGAVVNGTIKQIAPIPAITLGQTVTGTIAVGQARYYQVDVTAGLEPEFLLKGLPANGIVEMYISRNDLPTRTDFDWSSTQPFASEQFVSLPPVSSAGTYYILLYAPSLASTPVNFQLKVSAPIFEVRTTNFGTAGNSGTFTLKALGANFDSLTTARLTKSPGFQLSAQDYDATDSEFYATFDLRGVAPGTYNVVFTNKNGVTVTTSSSLTVVAATEAPAIVPHVIAPSAIRRGREFSFTVEWTNTSLNDAIVPLLTVGSTVPFGLDHNNYSLGTRYTFLGVNTQGGPAGILRPGQTERLTLWSYSDTEPGEYTVFVDRNGKVPEAPFDWASARRSVVTPSWSTADYDRAWQELVRSVGSNWSDFLEMISRNVSQLPEPTDEWPAILRECLTMELEKIAADLLTSVNGRIVAANSQQSIADVRVALVNTMSGVEFQTDTLADGSFVFIGLTPGPYQVEVRDSVVGGTANVTLVDGQHANVVIPVAPVPVLSLVVRDVAGNDLKNWGAQIWRNGKIIAIAGTDSSLPNQFTHIDKTTLAEGDRVLIQSAGFARLWIDATAIWTSSNSGKVTLTPESSVAIAVVNSDGMPASGGIVFAQPATGELPFLSAVPGNSNHFQLSNLPAGEYVLTYSSFDGNQQWSQPIVVSAGVSIDLGTVTTSTGSGSSGNAVSSTSSDSLIAAMSRGTFFADTFFTPTILAILAIVEWQVASGTEVGESFSLYYDYFYRGFEQVTTFPESSDLGLEILKHPVTHARIAELKQVVLESLLERSEWQQTFACEAEQTVTYDLSELVDAAWYEVYSNQSHFSKELWAYHEGMFNLITGGVSNGGTPPVTPVVPDYRKITGTVTATLKPGKSGVDVFFDLKYTIFDSVDFWPEGNRLPLIGQSFGLLDGLALMEIIGAANDQFWKVTVPYVELTTFSVERECGPDPVDSSKIIKRPVSFDPNDITGPAGAGPLNHIVADEVLPYVIRFENAASAGAPAATVVVTQQLDADLDWTSFRLGDMGFGSTIVSVPANNAFFQTRIDLRATRGVYVDITAGINAATGEVRWEFTSIDPATGLPPENPLVGFLPPNITGPQGEGFLNYTVRTKSNVVTGTRIDAVAPIVFDVNEPILTPPIFHTIDRGTPDSRVLSLAPTTALPTFTVSWSGTDDLGGSGIATYDLFVSDNGGTYTLALDDSSLTSFEFTGLPGHSYAFYSVATDLVGHVESIPAVPDTSTQVAATVNHNPTVVETTFSLNENAPLNTPVGTVSASDPDGDSLTFSIIDGNPAGAFSINPNSGLISIANPSIIDFETHPSFELSVRVQDSTGLTHSAIVTINLTDLNETLQLELGGSPVTWTKKQAPINILPQLTVTGGTSLAGGTLTLEIDVVRSSRKLIDQLGIRLLDELGTTSGPQNEGGRLKLQIQLGANATAAGVQSFLRNISFSTKGKGLKLPTRNVMVTATVGGQSSSVSQTINVRKK